MLILDQLLVSEEIFEKKFVCNLSKCKGECCIAGDSGAPVKNEEIKQLEAEFENYRPYLTENGIKRIEKNGFTSYDLEDRVHKTMLLEEGPCAFINYDKKGVANCGIEKAFLEGKSSFRKPISCHLYPIRESGIGELTAVNYEEWDICSDACALGEELQVPVYKFLRDPIERAYGAETYQAMDAYYLSKKS